MGPSCTRSTRTRTRTRARRALFKKQLGNSKNQENNSISAANSPVKVLSKGNDVENVDQICCSTPKAERFRIPEIKTCPPPPKKRRMLKTCSLRRTSIVFFAPPDIDLFFNFALSGIPV